MIRPARNITTLAAILGACNTIQDTAETTFYVCDQLTNHPRVEQLYRGTFNDVPLFMHGFLGLTKRAYEGTEDFVICVEKDKAGNASRSIYGNAKTRAIGESNGFPFRDLQVDSILIHHQLLAPLDEFVPTPTNPYIMSSSD